MTPMGRAYGYAFAATILWATVATAFKLGLHYFDHDIVQLLAWSVLMAVISLLFLLAFHQKQISLPAKKSIANSALLGALNPFLYYLILFKAYDLLPASEAQPLNYTWPITLSILSALIFRQKLIWPHIISMCLGLTGVITIATHAHFNLHFSNLFGVILAVGSSLIWASYWIINMKDTRPALQKMTLNFIFGNLYLILYLFMKGNIDLPPYSGIICAIWIGLCEMGLTFLFWMRALESAPAASSISHVVYLSPFMSFILLHFALGERISAYSVIGLVLIIGGVILGSVWNAKNVTKN